MPTIDEYFMENGIVSKPASALPGELRRIGRIEDDTEFFNAAFQSDYDIRIDGIDYYSNLWLFQKIADETRKFQDIFEPCCQSGILGCFLALESDGYYLGMDFNEFGIARAKSRAAANGLSPEIFQFGDFFEYSGTHEALVGRQVINEKWYDPNPDMVAKAVSVSLNIILLQSFHPGQRKSAFEKYAHEFAKHNFSFEASQKYEPLSLTGTDVYLIKASKKK